MPASAGICQWQNTRPNPGCKYCFVKLHSYNIYKSKQPRFCDHVDVRGSEIKHKIKQQNVFIIGIQDLFHHW